MVSEDNLRQSFLKKVQLWIETLPQEHISIDYNETPRYEYEQEIIIIHRDINSFELLLGISKYDNTYDVLIKNTFGNIQSTDVPLSNDLWFDLFGAVTKGQIKQWLWECKGKIVRTKTELLTASGTWTTFRTHFSWGVCKIFGLTTVRVMEFKSWD